MINAHLLFPSGYAGVVFTPLSFERRLPRDSPTIELKLPIINMSHDCHVTCCGLKSPWNSFIDQIIPAPTTLGYVYLLLLSVSLNTKVPAGRQSELCQGIRSIKLILYHIKCLLVQLFTKQYRILFIENLVVNLERYIKHNVMSSLNYI